MNIDPQFVRREGKWEVHGETLLRYTVRYSMNLYSDKDHSKSFHSVSSNSHTQRVENTACSGVFVLKFETSGTQGKVF